MLKKFLFYYSIIAFTVVLYVFVSKETMQNYMLLALMYASPLLYLFEVLKGYFDKRSLLLWASLLLISSTYITHPERFRISTIGYSAMFFITYMFFVELVKDGKFKVDRIIKLLTLIVKANAIVLIIQQVSTLAGIPVFNHGWLEDGTMKWNTLNYEPSYIGPVLTIIMYTIVKINETSNGTQKFKDYFHSDKILWISYLYTCLTCFSVTCILSVFVFSFYFFKTKYIIQSVLGLAVMFIIGSLLVSNDIFDRISTLLSVLGSFNPYLIYDTDSSSSARIVPWIFYFQDFKFFDINTWIGHGCDYASDRYIYLIFNNQVDSNMGISGFVDVLYNYGIIAVIPYLSYLYLILRKNRFLVVLYICLFFVFNLNMYIPWTFLMMAYLLDTYCIHKKYLIYNR